MRPPHYELKSREPDWWAEPDDFSIVVAAPVPKLAKVQPPPPLASLPPTRVAKNYPQTMARLTAPPRARESEVHAYPMLAWEPAFSWRAVWPFLVAVAWMASLTWYVDYLERSALKQAIGDCPAAVARVP